MVFDGATLALKGSDVTPIRHVEGLLYVGAWS